MLCLFFDVLGGSGAAGVGPREVLFLTELEKKLRRLIR